MRVKTKENRNSGNMEYQKLKDNAKIGVMDHKSQKRVSKRIFHWGFH